MPSLLRDPGPKHAHLKDAYEEFTRVAFGEDQAVWQTMCPISVENWKQEWSEGEKFVFVQSREDSLVPYWQTERMKTALLKSKGEALVVRELEAGGDHDELWGKGDRLAEIVVEVVEGLT